MKRTSPASVAAPVDVTAIAACPGCRANLRADCDPQYLVCTSCGRRFSMLMDGVPSLLCEDDLKGESIQQEISVQNSLQELYEDTASLFYHWDLYSTRFLGDLVGLNTDNSLLVLDYGCGVGNLGLLYPGCPIVGLEIAPRLIERARRRLPLVIQGNAPPTCLFRTRDLTSPLRAASSTISGTRQAASRRSIVSCGRVAEPSSWTC